jgi:hypothetical protein
MPRSCLGTHSINFWKYSGDYTRPGTVEFRKFKLPPPGVCFTFSLSISRSDRLCSQILKKHFDKSARVCPPRIWTSTFRGTDNSEVDIKTRRTYLQRTAKYFPSIFTVGGDFDSPCGKEKSKQNTKAIEAE